MKLPEFDYVRAQSIEQAVALLAENPGEAKVLAGGQSLIPLLAFRMLAPALLVDVTRIVELRGITTSAEALELRACTRWHDIQRHPELARAHPLLCEAIRHVAHYQIRNRGTVGGSIAHADPSAEFPAIAVTCDARILLTGAEGRTRSIAAADFIEGPLMTALRPDEIVRSIQFPAWPAARRWAFEEFARRTGDFALAGVALFYDIDGSQHACNVHVGAFGVGDRAVRLARIESLLEGQRLDAPLIEAAAALVSESIDPTDDLHAPAEYRKALTTVLLRRALHRAAGIPVQPI